MERGVVRWIRGRVRRRDEGRRRTAPAARGCVWTLGSLLDERSRAGTGADLPRGLAEAGEGVKSQSSGRGAGGGCCAHPGPKNRQLSMLQPNRQSELQNVRLGDY